MRHRSGGSGIAGWVLALALAAGCGVAPGEPEPSEEELVAEAVAFGDLSLPPSARVLAVDAQHGRDSLYRLAVSIDPDELDALLDSSDFTATLDGDRNLPSGLSIMDDITLSATDSAFAQDFHGYQREGDHGQRTVFRRLYVDRSDPEQTVVHWWLFDT